MSLISNFLPEWCNPLFPLQEEEMTEVWLQDDDDPSLSVHANTVPESHTSKLIKFYVMFLLKWQTLFKVSDNGVSVLFLFLAKFFALLISVFVVSKDAEKIVTELPKNVAEAKKLLGLGSDTFTKFNMLAAQSVTLCTSLTLVRSNIQME